MIAEEIFCEVRKDTFLAEDPIAPLESYEVEKTEAEREILCARMLELLRKPKKLPG